MIVVRTFDGDSSAAAEFTRRVWTGRYDLSIPVIDWNEAYFEWQLLNDLPGTRDYLVAAYDGDKLVGTLFAEPLNFQLRGEPILATMGSWLSVDPSYRGKGIAQRLAEEQRQRHRERDAKFMLGFGVLGTDGPKFWQARKDTVVLGNVGFWVRLLDYRAVAAWTPSWVERISAQVAGPFLSGAPQLPETPEVRRFTEADLPRCLELAQAAQTHADLGYRWTEGRLRHQLSGPKLPRTFVFERAGRVEGFINYYLVSMKGHTVMQVAVIDLMAFSDLAASDKRRLVQRALVAMAEEGAGLAMALRVPTPHDGTFWRAGFVPTPKQSNFLCTISDPGIALEGVRRLYVHWR